MAEEHGRPRIEVLGSGREVGRAAIAVWFNGRAILLDYGVNFDEDDNPVFPGHIRPRDLEAVVLTHSHLDHLGAAPSLYVSIKPKLIATKVTLEVGRLLLYDMVKLNGPQLPYDEIVVDEMIESATIVDYGEEVEAGDFLVKLLYNGHIPGSAAVLVDLVQGVLYGLRLNHAWLARKLYDILLHLDTVLLCRSTARRVGYRLG